MLLSQYTTHQWFVYFISVHEVEVVIVHTCGQSSWSLWPYRDYTLYHRYSTHLTQSFPITTPGLIGANITESLWAHNPNFVVKKITCLFHSENDHQIRPQFCTCHDISAVVTCVNLWPDYIFRIIMESKTIFTRFQLWAHEHIMKWILGNGLACYIM